jgi:hypothetical protein
MLLLLPVCGRRSSAEPCGLAGHCSISRLQRVLASTVFELCCARRLPCTGCQWPALGPGPQLAGLPGC